ncbi:GNAT family N-acetyltransferase [Streptomyces griseus]|uniref:GNAT family N-acetyltransferase n=1 Tax=Streptomyces sp. CMC78 TaxID=3231512 RepID=A0AB33KSE0_9ACTN|nr:GNAT family N-acetyltransferase [Streptomyces sp. ID01-9D]MDX5575104.1 GNAT family N-acetyltransferase [Streptomyces sp. ID01-9D]WTC91009.1 GNAT family N-acetyltransferase [Streptomyces griseus]WTD66359.1 GNAT family N-acetyltransferase [Streptomyces griseus]
MTTTLRPSGPLQQGADGARARQYDVCDNGRPVGAVAISTDDAFGATAGVLGPLSVEEPRRRRGRGTIAALAAEEVLRGWGCTRVRVEVPADNDAARRLAAALGYIERSRNMVKDLGPETAQLPVGLTARAMSEEEFAAWRQEALLAYAQDWIDRGVEPEQARRKSEADHAAHLPDGLATEGVRFDVLVHAGEVVGHVWVALRELPPGGPAGFVFDVEVREEHRGRGYGRALMLLAEDTTRACGADRLGLHVFASNTPALRLYESLGYTTTRYNLAKAL